jgi:hypothetical protein
MKISREWEMPNSNTFNIKCIERLIYKYGATATLIIDPFANTSRIAHITNDIDPSMPCNYSLDALDFLTKMEGKGCDLLLFDPPYSPRQIAECYNKMGQSVDMKTTQASFWGNLKKEISRVVKAGGYCISFGWNSGGIGKNLGFEIVEILIVAHGGWHNDTICVVERKVQSSLFTDL